MTDAVRYLIGGELPEALRTNPNVFPGLFYLTCTAGGLELPKGFWYAWLAFALLWWVSVLA